jgi:predicted O-linked N-acetylglucosamine transferase (SPINDLY family)
MLLDDRIQALLKSRQFEEVHMLSAEYCQAHPDDIDGWFRLGMIETHLRLPRQALASFQRIIAAGQMLGEACFNIGRLYALHGQLENALKNYRQAIIYRPDFAEAYSTLGELLRRLGQLSEADECYRRAMSLRPDYNNLRIHMVRRYETDAEIERATKHFQAMMHSNLLFLRSYHVLCGPEEMLAVHLEWDRVHGEEGRAHAYRSVARAGADKCLRIGYVSPDFRRHAVSSFFEPILASHDRSVVEIYCYSEVNTPDEVTERIRVQADGWCTTVGLSDAQVAQRIVDDGIDVLVDLAGHTSNNRLQIFTYRPAPVQVTYLGYFTSTGLAAMDYWLSDDILTPQDTLERSSESIYRLPRSCLVYQAPDDAPEVAERPDDAVVTFGSFNDLSKVAPESVQRWSDILRRVPDSRLLIKARQLADVAARDKLRESFAVHGVASERLIFRPPTVGQAEHLAVFGEVDIALDSMPRTGGSTTAEALWMGVPVVSLAGTRYIERLSATMLHAVGLDDLITSTPAEYIDKAVALAGDAPYRKKLRLGMRQRLAASPLCDARALSRALEQAFRDMWARKFPARA